MAPTVTQFNDVTVVTDGMAVLECRVEAKPMPTFTWITPAGLTGFNVQNCIQDPTNNLIFISRLEFNRTAMPSDAGQYICTGYNYEGDFSQNATLTVLGETHLLHTSWDYTLNYQMFTKYEPAPFDVNKTYKKRNFKAISNVFHINNNNY